MVNITSVPVTLEVDKVYKVLVKKGESRNSVFTNLSPFLWVSVDGTVDVYGYSGTDTPTLYSQCDLPASGANTAVTGHFYFPAHGGVLPVNLAIKANTGTPTILAYGMDIDVDNATDIS